jgi:mannonate dehydratase
MKRMKDSCDKYGIALEAIRMDSEYIMLRKGAERDRKLDSIAGNIQKASQIGAKVITYHWTVIPIRRTGTRPDRGGATYERSSSSQTGKSFRSESGRRLVRRLLGAHHNFPGARYSRLQTARRADGRSSLRPAGLPFGYQGAENWDAPSVFEGFKRYEKIVDSPYNGFQLCLGTTGEGLKKPLTEVLPIVQYLGERGKIYQIHMRNIRGGLNDF